MPVLLLPLVCYAFFLTAENAKIMLYNKFQSPMKVTVVCPVFVSKPGAVNLTLEEALEFLKWRIQKLLDIVHVPTKKT